MKTIKKLLLAGAICLLTAATALAQPILRLPSAIGDHMVLQADTTVRLHGWADPNTTVTVAPSWGGEVTAKAGFDTAWAVELRTPAASAEPHSITFRTKKAEKTIDDVLIGQVWLCSGQSNMNWSAEHGIVDMQEELTRPMNPQIRSLNLSNSVAVLLYEALRQNGFAGMQTKGELHRLHWREEKAT